MLFEGDSFICVRPWSNHAYISVRLASSPSPKSEETAVSDSGSGCAAGSANTDCASVCLVNP